MGWGGLGKVRNSKFKAQFTVYVEAQLFPHQRPFSRITSLIFASIWGFLALLLIKNILRMSQEMFATPTSNISVVRLEDVSAH